MKEKNCLYCHMEFKPKRSNAKFCSIPCSNKDQGEKRISVSNVAIACKSCGIKKAANKFSYVNKWDTALGRVDTCKACGAAERERNRRDNLWGLNIKKYLLTQARARAKRAGMEFTITENDISIPEKCPVLGVDLLLERSKIKESHHRGLRYNLGPSIDRIDSTKGYVPGNVTIVSTRANILKSDMTVDELLGLYNFYCKE